MRITTRIIIDMPYRYMTVDEKIERFEKDRIAHAIYMRAWRRKQKYLKPDVACYTKEEKSKVCICDICGHKAKSVGGLGLHKRHKHCETPYPKPYSRINGQLPVE